VTTDPSPTARALLAPELVQGSPGITADRLADKHPDRVGPRSGHGRARRPPRRGRPTDPVGSALGIVRALPEPVAAQADVVRRTTAPAPDRAAARPDPTTTAGPELQQTARVLGQRLLAAAGGTP
jgi:hypothetical protein